MARPRAPLGVLAADDTRSIVVLSEHGELAVAVRDCVDRALALVRDARPHDVAEIMLACRPWPWMIVGDRAELPRSVAAIAHRRPVIVLWHGAAPETLPGHARSFSRFTDLAQAIDTALRQTVGGMRLAHGSGVELPGGRVVAASTLQALVSSHPHPFRLPVSSFRATSRLLLRHGVDWRPVRSPGGRGTALGPVRAHPAGVAT